MRVFYFSAGKKRGGVTRPLFCPYSLYSLFIILMRSLPAIVLATILGNLCLSLDTVEILATSPRLTSHETTADIAHADPSTEI